MEECYVRSMRSQSHYIRYEQIPTILFYVLDMLKNQYLLSLRGYLKSTEAGLCHVKQSSLIRMYKNVVIYNH